MEFISNIVICIRGKNLESGVEAMNLLYVEPETKFFFHVNVQNYHFIAVQHFYSF